MLLTNDFVMVASMDFSTAFDTVRHQPLLEKIGILNPLDEQISCHHALGGSIKRFIHRFQHSTKVLCLVLLSMLSLLWTFIQITTATYWSSTLMTCTSSSALTTS